jgi:hypothetical protein
MALGWKRLSCIVMDVRTNDGYMLITKCFTLDGNGVSGLEVREGWKGKRKNCACSEIRGVIHARKFSYMYFFK